MLHIWAFKQSILPSGSLLVQDNWWKVKFYYCNTFYPNQWRPEGCYISLKHIMLIHSFRHIPSTAHSLGEFDQVTGTKYDCLVRSIRVNLHLSLQQVACFFRRVSPWEFAWRTSPPTLMSQQTGIKIVHYLISMY